MKTLLRYLLLLFASGGFCECVLADGKVFFREGVPANIPYQRALLIFNEGKETLILQSKYEFSQSTDVNSLGWVVPVPSVPDLGSMDADVARSLFMSASLRTNPKIYRISSYIPLIIMLCVIGSLVFLIFCLIEYLFLDKIGLPKAVWGRRIRNGAFLCVLFLIMLSMFGFHLGEIHWASRYIELVKAEKVGIYDIKVIKSNNSEAIVDWLKENGFAFSDIDIHVFEDYVTRNWCFVVAKVEPDSETQENQIVAEGMVAPLILKFETDKAVYPLALTSTIGTDTQVLLYTLSDNKLSCGERLTLRHARVIKPFNLLPVLIEDAEPDGSIIFKDIPIFKNIPEQMILCKFKKKLTSEEMKKDLVFEYAPDNNPYVETMIVW